jgi:hypothetical protein
VPNPIAPGCWRTKPDVSACAASTALAPPRIKLMRSRRRRASSKSSTLAAASILRWRSSMVSVIIAQRAAAVLGGTAPELITLEPMRRGRFRPVRFRAARC